MKLSRMIFTFAPALVVITLASTTAIAQAQVPRADSRDNHEGAVATQLTDGQVLQVVRTLNDAEIKQAQEAADESDNAIVKQVAEMIIAQHEESNEAIDELLDGDLDLDDSPLSENLAETTEETHEALQDLSGAQYDCAYLQKQVAQHQEAITLSKTQLEPNAKNTGVKQFLTSMGPKLEQHLKLVQESRAKTAGCNA